MQIPIRRVIDKRNSLKRAAGGCGSELDRGLVDRTLDCIARRVIADRDRSIFIVDTELSRTRSVIRTDIRRAYVRQVYAILNNLIRIFGIWTAGRIDA